VIDFNSAYLCVFSQRFTNRTLVHRRNTEDARLRRENNFEVPTLLFSYLRSLLSGDIASHRQKQRICRHLAVDIDD